MAATNRAFTFLDDEISIVTVAQYPVGHTVGLFTSGVGQHEHPPLFDLIYHFWLRLTGSRMALLRLPSIFLFLTGLWTLAVTALRLAGWDGFWACLAIGVVWPFGFHYGRVAGWYSFCFFLLALTTYCYLRLVESPRAGLWLKFGLCCTALIYTNYFAWPLILCFAFDYFVRRRTSKTLEWRPLLILLASLLLVSLPLASAFMSTVRPEFSTLLLDPHTGQSHGIASFLPAGGKGFSGSAYTLVLSESVAPWFWPLSVPAMLAILLCAGIVTVRAPREMRRVAFYFLLLLAAMAVFQLTGDTPRLLFIGAWGILPLGVTWAACGKRRERAALSVSLAIIAGVGWFGTISRDYYSFSGFTDPWEQVTKDLAGPLSQGSVIVTDEPNYFFYLNYQLGIAPRATESSDLGLDEYLARQVNAYSVKMWMENGPVSAASTMLITRRISYPPELYARLSSRCRPPRVRLSIPDKVYELKKRFYPATRLEPHPIEILEYDCTSR
jgi:hypothetical protein